jgi:hypothetical protein
MFLVLFLKRTNSMVDGFLGPAPDPVAPLRGGFWGNESLAELMFLVLFLKRTNSGCWPASGLVASFRGGVSLAELMFLVLFLKEQN